ncbi:ABC transporter ATP-binding protein/permease [Marinomonas spartinae]|uniref:ABC transporter ATP-binding protein/permease n=1 Tax=Marinomonas spartinae TaxID=1792290 RepID=UPI0018F22DDB|nr:ATP-binding cassette domain-containing protein [Marinomonas spartinae]MBJ7556573.1 ABC transporter ATP-binding protein/permease [Marinomonas spartinae]
MPIETNQMNDERSYKLNRLLFRRLYDLSLPYWTRNEAWKSWLIVIMLLFSSAAIGIIGGYVSYLVADYTNALVDKNASIYWSLMIWTTFVVFMRILLSSVTGFFSSWIVLNWRQWMTEQITQSYMRNRTYYEIEQSKFIDNPDQRIQDEVANVCQTIVGLPQFVISSLTNIAVQASIILNVSTGLFWFILIYAIVNTFVTIWIYNPTIKLNWAVTVAKANMRTKLMAVRDHAETIAFYRGERSERLHLNQRLKDVMQAKLKLMFYNNINMSAVNEVLSLIFNLLPILFVVPLYLQGHISYGSIGQVTAAASTVLSGLSVISQLIPTATSVMPSAMRLAEIQEKSLALSQENTNTNRIHYIEGDHIELNQINAETPNGEQQLVKDLTMKILPGHHTVIVGQTGVGKSSLLRVISGLWNRGQGEVVLPHWRQLMFIPQQPYMHLADLRSQLLYPTPSNTGSFDDADIQEAFTLLGHPNFLAKHGGLDCIKDWRKVLSLGEQQLIAFTRIVLRKPRYVFLDEATSAMDVENEKHVYKVLKQLDITFVSVGHRETLLRFHNQKLHLLPDSKWQLTQQTTLFNAMH